MMLHRRGCSCHSAPYTISRTSVAVCSSGRVVTGNLLALSLPVTCACALDPRPHVFRHVRRLDAVAQHRDVRREMRKGDGGAQVRERARTLLAAVEHEGRAGGAGEHRRGVQSHAQVELRPAAGHGVAGRHRRESLRDERLAEAHAFAVDDRPVRFEQVERLGVEHDTPHVAEQRNAASWIRSQPCSSSDGLVTMPPCALPSAIRSPRATLHHCSLSTMVCAHF